MRRFEPGSWDEPHLDIWLQALDTIVREVGPTGILVAHSLSCLLVAHWSARSQLPIAGAFLVAVPDPTAAAFPAEAASFAHAPTARLRFPSMIVASINDPYASMAFARACARQWGSTLVEAGPLGHINAASDIGEWTWGRDQLQSFIKSIDQG